MADGAKEVFRLLWHFAWLVQIVVRHRFQYLQRFKSNFAELGRDFIERRILAYVVRWLAALTEDLLPFGQRVFVAKDELFAQFRFAVRHMAQDPERMVPAVRRRSGCRRVSHVHYQFHHPGCALLE